MFRRFLSKRSSSRKKRAAAGMPSSNSYSPAKVSDVVDVHSNEVQVVPLQVAIILMFRAVSGPLNKMQIIYLAILSSFICQS
jgi:hypothetical protein